MPKPSNCLAAALAAIATVSAAAPAIAAQDSPAIETRAEIGAKIEAKFKSIDANGDGTIDKSEIDAVNAKAAERTDATIEKKLQEEFAKLDTNKDNQVSLAEFRAIAPPVKGAPAEILMTRMDGNKDGKISLKEYTDVTLQAFDRLDSNKDGKISEAERKAAQSR